MNLVTSPETVNRHTGNGFVPISVSDAERALQPLLDTREERYAAVDETVARWDALKKQSETVAGILRRNGYPRRADKMEQCGVFGYRRICKGCGHTEHRSTALHCSDRFCPICQSHRAKTLSEEWERGLQWYTLHHPNHPLSFVTLTLKDTGELPNRKDMSRWLKRLWKQPFWKAYRVLGGIVAWEIVVGKNSNLWHVHAHVLLITEHPIPLITEGQHTGRWQNAVSQQLSDAWNESNGGRGYIVDGRRFDGNTRELIKYSVKGFETVNDERFGALVEWTHGMHTVDAFGCLRGNKELRAAMDAVTDAGECCPECGGHDFDVDVLRWDSRLHRYVVTGTANTGPPHGDGSRSNPGG